MYSVFTEYQQEWYELEVNIEEKVKKAHSFSKNRKQEL
jgi:hypothetical protein